MPKITPLYKVIKQAISIWWDNWVDLTLCGLIWLLSWILIVPGPPATLAFYHVAHHLAYGKSLGLREMWEGGKRYFLTGWLWMLINLGVSLMAYTNLLFYHRLEGAWAEPLKYVFVFLYVLWVIIQFYALPYLMEQDEKSVWLALRNSLFSIIAFPGYSLIILGITAGLIVLSLNLVAPLFLGGPGLIAILGSCAIRERLETYKRGTNENAYSATPS